MIRVAAIGRAVVKATRFLHEPHAFIGPTGIAYDRAFFIVEGDGQLVSQAAHSRLIALAVRYDPDADTLRAELPDGSCVEGHAAATGPRLDIDYVCGRAIPCAEVGGQWRNMLSSFVGRSVRLMRCVGNGASTDVFPVTLLTTGAIARLERQIGRSVDPARFRAGLVLDSEGEHAEDGWEDRQLQVGSVILKVRTPIPRCVIPSFHPTTGQRDMNVLRQLALYRPVTGLPDGLDPAHRAPSFGVYAQVVTPGTVHVGDAASLLD